MRVPITWIETERGETIRNRPKWNLRLERMWRTLFERATKSPQELAILLPWLKAKWGLKAMKWTVSRLQSVAFHGRQRLHADGFSTSNQDLTVIEMVEELEDLDSGESVKMN